MFLQVLTLAMGFCSWSIEILCIYLFNFLGGNWTYDQNSLMNLRRAGDFHFIQHFICCEDENDTSNIFTYPTMSQNSTRCVFWVSLSFSINEFVRSSSESITWRWLNKDLVFGKRISNSPTSMFFFLGTHISILSCSRFSHAMELGPNKKQLGS